MSYNNLHTLIIPLAIYRHFKGPIYICCKSVYSTIFRDESFSGPRNMETAKGLQSMVERDMF